MRLLLGTHNALVLWDDGVERVLHESAGVYYGITWSPERLYVIARGRVPRMLVYNGDRQLEEPPPLDLGAPGYSGPHQIHWYEGRLYVTNTTLNRVDVWDELVRAGAEIRFECPAGRDVNHINSIWRDPETSLFYVVEHRREEMPKRIRVMNAIGRVKRTISLAGGYLKAGIHNVFVKDLILYTLCTEGIVLHDFVDGSTQLVKIDGAGYLRGLAVAADVFFVGDSEFQPRDQRCQGVSKVHVLDCRLNKIDEICLGSQFGQLLEIRALSEDLAHNGEKPPGWLQ